MENIKEYEKEWDARVKKSNPVREAIGHISDEDLKTQTQFYLQFIGREATILDAGCGYGRLMEYFSKYAKRVVGVDICNEMLKAAYSGLELYKASITDLPFKGNTFSVVVCDRVLIHLTRSDMLKSLSEFRRVLEPNGILLFSVPYLYCLTSIKWEINRTFIFSWGQSIITARNNFTRRNVTKFLRETGFRNLYIVINKNNIGKGLLVKAEKGEI